MLRELAFGGKEMKKVSLKRIGTGNSAVVSIGDRELFFSYQTLVAMFVPGKGYLRTDRKFSTTTSKHIGLYLGGKGASTVPHDELQDMATV
jgi:hypothetical protein